MNRLTAFAYSQARLQAHNGQRPGTAPWHRLSPVGDLGGFLQQARQGPLRPWIVSFSAENDSDEIEYHLRRLARDHIHAIAQWQPRAWRSAVAWVTTLLDLPALQHMLSGNAPPNWMYRDAVLQPIAEVDRDMRPRKISEIYGGVLTQTGRNGGALLDGWLKRWRQLWPDMSEAERSLLEQLVALWTAHVEAVSSEDADADTLREGLTARINASFRRYPQQSVTAFLYISLLILDLERLRGALVSRALFPELQGRS